ncbi:MAG: hypothetical protein NTX22_10815 [Ignavibacteriales bacterium]|nr:hypothetical protein [Ignavibacteriales bacterium]
MKKLAARLYFWIILTLIVFLFLMIGNLNTSENNNQLHISPILKANDSLFKKQTDTTNYQLTKNISNEKNRSLSEIKR